MLKGGGAVGRAQERCAEAHSRDKRHAHLQPFSCSSETGLAERLAPWLESQARQMRGKACQRRGHVGPMLGPRRNSWEEIWVHLRGRPGDVETASSAQR